MFCSIFQRKKKQGSDCCVVSSRSHHFPMTRGDWKSKGKSCTHRLYPRRMKNITALHLDLKSANNGSWKMTSLQGRQNKNLEDNHQSFIFKTSSQIKFFKENPIKLRHFHHNKRNNSVRLERTAATWLAIEDICDFAATNLIKANLTDAVMSTELMTLTVMNGKCK